MQLSSNVTKSFYAKKGVKKEIATRYSKFGEEENIDDVTDIKEVNKWVIEEGYREKEKIIKEAMEKAISIEEEAYKKGYTQGYSNGMEDGEREREEILKNAVEEKEKMVSEAIEIIKKANIDYRNYLKEKEEDIKDLAFLIAEKILNKKIEDDEYLIEMVNLALEEARGEKTVLIKCNKENINILEPLISKWKLTLGIKEGIFIIEEEVDKGKIIIEKETGTISISTEEGLEKIRKELLGR
ncbi:MAG: hypothetical protein ACRC28_01045 [Clostridium sp.]|uniref:FliH/SctL family protein n=1 Tax=Clostridium sp. TaxID=1506 RepID=UPI003F30D81F